MDVAVILTYRCNSRCSMCHAWQYPTLPAEEVSLQTLERIPGNLNYLNLTGGEPTLRSDLVEIVDLLYPKAMQLEISSNGLHSERLEPIIAKYPDVKIRLSLEGFEATNTRIRGEKEGFARKVRGLLRLRELGGRDLGFAITIQDDNVQDLVELFRFAEEHGFELATSTLHNGFQFHKSDNAPYDRARVAWHIQQLITELLKTNNVKNWFRAYLDLGLIARVMGRPRLLPCTAATDFAFVDPWSDVFACNVRPDLRLGNLAAQGWDEVFGGPQAAEIRQNVLHCPQNCWMVGSAKTAMRIRRFAKIPKIGPLLWVVKNKLRVTLGSDLRFDQEIDYSQVREGPPVPQHPSFIDRRVKRKVVTKGEAHYSNEGYSNV